MTVFAFHKKVAFISKHVLQSSSCASWPIFLFHFVGQQLLFDWPNEFPPTYDKTLSQCTCTNPGPSEV